MNSINGIDAIRLAQEVSKLPDGKFIIAFYPYNRTKGEASGKLETKKNCTFRPQLPQDRFSIDGDNFFLFKDMDGNEKMCYRILLRYIGFPQDDFKLRKINWL
jgi:hypothetical protein